MLHKFTSLTFIIFFHKFPSPRATFRVNGLPSVSKAFQRNSDCIERPTAPLLWRATVRPLRRKTMSSSNSTYKNLKKKSARSRQDRNNKKVTHLDKMMNSTSGVSFGDRWFLVGGWTNPFEKKLYSQIGFTFPKFSGWRFRKYLSCHHLENFSTRSSSDHVIIVNMRLF